MKRHYWFTMALILTSANFNGLILGQEKSPPIINGNKITNAPIYDYQLREPEKRGNGDISTIEFSAMPFEEPEKRLKRIIISVPVDKIEVRERTDDKKIVTLDAVLTENLTVVQYEHQFATTAVVNAPKEYLDDWQTYLINLKDKLDIDLPISRYYSGWRLGEHRIIFEVRGEKNLEIWIKLDDLAIEVDNTVTAAWWDAPLSVKCGRQLIKDYDSTNTWDLIKYYLDAPKATIVVGNEQDKKKWEFELSKWREELKPKVVLPK